VIRPAAFLALSCFTAAAWPQDPAQVDKPAVKPGNSWSQAVLDGYTKVVQRTDELVVASVTDSEIKFTDKAGAPVLAVDAELATTFGNNRAYSRPIRVFSFPMTVGKTWSHVNESIDPRCGPSVSELTAKVVGWEDVTVPAGKFRAMRVDSDGKWTSRCGTGKLVFKYWYAPQVKWTVRSESIVYADGRIFSNVARELTSYKVD